MNSFCEECGNKLSQGDKFCQECGTPVPQNQEAYQEENKQTDDIAFDFFSQKRIRLGTKKDANYGVLLTNFNKFATKFGAGEVERFKQFLREYIANYERVGMQYLVLDVSDNIIRNVRSDNWKQHVDLLRKGVKRIKSKCNSNTRFVMILGGHEIIPMPLFPNPNTNASDTDVDSDLPFSTLSVKDPMESQEARNPLLSVGRIPTGRDTTMDDLYTLLTNTQEAISTFKNDTTFGLSANCWQEVSNLINQKVCKETLYISPGLTVNNLGQYYKPETNVHYFNLHGSNSAAEWYGQKGQDYPVAFAPQVIAQNQSYNIIGVEACYGARFIGLTKNESILLSALSSKTVSFVGSSRIAWGPSAPPMNLADVAIHDYLDFIQQGCTAGDAFLKARINAFNNSVEKDPATSLLTMMEFNLYGDPLFFFGAAQKSMAKGMVANTIKSDNQGIDGDQIEDLGEEDMIDTKETQNDPDSVYNMVAQAVDEAQRKITALINKKVWEKYPEFKGIEPAFKKYSFEGKSFNRLTYGKQLENFDQYLLVSTDTNGEILAEYDSK